MRIDLCCGLFLLLSDHRLVQQVPHSGGDDDADEVYKFSGVYPVVGLHVYRIAVDDVLVHVKHDLYVPPPEVSEIEGERVEIVLALEHDEPEAATSKGSRYTEISTAFYAFFCRFYIVVRIAVSLII